MSKTVRKGTATSKAGNSAGSVDTIPQTGDSDKLKGELDDLLDEIDEVLETNAEQFVRLLPLRPLEYF